MRLIEYHSPEFECAPQRIRDLFVISRYMPAWSQAEWSLEVGASIELQAADGASACVLEGDTADPSLDRCRASLQKEPFVFVVKKQSDDTALQAEFANYKSYKRHAVLHLWDRDEPQTRYEFGLLSFFTTDP